MNARTHHSASWTIAALLLGALACGRNPAAPEPVPFSGDPVVSTEPAANAPTPPAGANLRMVCQDGPGAVTTGQANPSPTCPVIRWGEYVYWVFSDGSNGSSMTVVAYDGAGNERHSVTRTGARYLWKIESGQGTITLYGQGGSNAPNGRTIELTWDELKF
ncbi:MAG: hypothetical protein AB7L66_08535 [Gemmatimonadales bacterium]